MGKKRIGRPLKVGNRLDPGVCRWSATQRWKALKDSYNFSSDLTPIGDLSREIGAPKVPGIQTRTISGLLLGSPRKKCHSDVASAESCRKYYMGEGGGFPPIRAVVSLVSFVSLVSPKLPVAYPSIKGVLESELTNQQVGLMQIQVRN
jgi:hypothetical protein